MPSSRWVFPVPVGPYRTSGLAPAPGSSTAAWAEAWATRLHGPTTKSARNRQRRLFGVRAVYRDARGLGFGSGWGGGSSFALSWAAFLPSFRAGGGAGTSSASGWWAWNSSG